MTYQTNMNTMFRNEFLLKNIIFDAPWGFNFFFFRGRILNGIKYPQKCLINSLMKELNYPHQRLTHSLNERRFFYSQMDLSKWTKVIFSLVSIDRVRLRCIVAVNILPNIDLTLHKNSAHLSFDRFTRKT